MGRTLAKKRKDSGVGFSRVHVAISDKALDEIHSMIRERPGVTFKGIINSAVDEYIFPGTKADITERLFKECEANRAALINGARENARLRTVCDLLLDTFVVYVKVWMCHTQDIPREHQEAALAAMKRRYAAFKELVLEELKGEDKLFEAIRTEIYEEEPELQPN